MDKEEFAHREHPTKLLTPFPIAIAQMPIKRDARQNGNQVCALMSEAAAGGARLIQFPEGALSGYAQNPIQDWAEYENQHRAGDRKHGQARARI